MKHLHLIALIALIAVLGLLHAGPSIAQDKGRYLSGSIGLSLPNDSDVDGTGIDTAIDLNSGLGLAAAFGNYFTPNWRAEGEINYRNSDVDSIGGTSGSGDLSAFGLMVNGYYDFATDSAWTPYIGLGVGAASVSFDGVSPVGGSQIDDSDLAFAYQAIAGISRDVTEQTAMFAEYRFFGVPDLGLKTDSGVSVDSDYGEHRIMVGLKWSFDPPKPAPEPAPVPAAKPIIKAAPAVQPPPAPTLTVEIVRNYLVFFDWDQSVLTADARAILAEAARNSQKAAISRIEATGHADRSGRDSYNISLSQRRAQAVATELIRLGVAAKNIAISWKGEREPLVSTPDGVREPQNRRVEIVFN